MRSKKIAYAILVALSSITFADVAVSGDSPTTVVKRIVNPPVARLSVSPTSGTAPLSVSADASASTDPKGRITSTSINFGDGTTVNAATATHIFSTAGTFSVKATVTDSRGLHASKTVKVVVASASPPVAQLSVSPTSGTAPLSVAADASASSDPNGTITSTKINFGDGTTVNGATATHVFTTAGTFTVTATVTDSKGLSASKTANVVVTSQGSGSGQGFTTHGFTIPSAHPRLWWTPSRVTAAKSWLA